MEPVNQVNEQIVLEKYQKAIDYYWTASRYNKKSYKWSRYLIIILGATVTLFSSLSSAGFIEEATGLKITFAIITPLLAAILTIVGGFSQNFHWGATWRDMVVNAMKLEKARDLFLAEKPEKRNAEKELESMYTLIIGETQSFFQRVLDGEAKSPEEGNEGLNPK
jgi:hypothetical protein